MSSKLTYIWDYDIDEERLRDLLSGRTTLGRLDKKWATIRLLEYAPYPEIVRLLGYRGIVDSWPGAREHVRSQGRRRGFDFLIEWLKTHHPDKITDG